MDKNTFCEIMLESKSSFKFLGAPDGFWLGVTDDGIEKCIHLMKCQRNIKRIV